MLGDDFAQLLATVRLELRVRIIGNVAEERCPDQRQVDPDQYACAVAEVVQTGGVRSCGRAQGIGSQLAYESEIFGIVLRSIALPVPGRS